MFKVNIKADSLNSAIVFNDGSHPRITTMEVTFPRYILAEVNTHRALTRNSASSRAIPFRKMVKMVQENPFIPMKWMKDHSGMQGAEYLDDLPASELSINAGLSKDDPYAYVDTVKAKDILDGIWGATGEYERPKGSALYHMVEIATELNKYGVTKQLANRLLEPFMWHTALITATEWENFYALRVEEGADIHLQKIAGMMLDAMNESTPKLLKPGEWHIPYGDDINESKLYDTLRYELGISDNHEVILTMLPEFKRKIAVARAARLSYMTLGEDPKIDYKADFKIHDKLAKDGHWSCFEHVAKTMSEEEFMKYGYIQPIIESHPMSNDVFNSFDNLPGSAVGESKGYNVGYTLGYFGNFRGFVQYRKMFPNENRKDSRLIKK